jgi:two-component system sensor histidine kinase ChvG
VELSLDSPEKEGALLRRIAQEETRMERLLARLRELGRIDNTIEQEETEKIDLAALIPLILARYSHDRADIRFENALSCPVFVLANPDRITQALTNPLDNAVSFSPPGGLVRVGLSKSGAKLVISIDDQGRGIREEDSEKYFERFYSERNDEEREGHSGLGLAITRAIAAAYGGACSLSNIMTNAAVAGCRFTLSLPAY